MEHTTVLDFGGLGFALANEAKRGSTDWEHPLRKRTQPQRRLIRLLNTLRSDLLATNCASLLSRNTDDLNLFLKKHGHKAAFNNIKPGQTGLATSLNIQLDMTIEAAATTLLAPPPKGGNPVQYRAFKIMPDAEIDVFQVGSRRMFKIETQNGLDMWLMATKQPKDALGLVELALDAMPGSIRLGRRFQTLVVPFVSIDRTVSPDWLRGMETTDTDCVIDQVKQAVKIEIGASGLAAEFHNTTKVNDPADYVLDQGFAGWFTDGHNPVPLAPFYAARDSWVRL